jgi:hypothetical protein
VFISDDESDHFHFKHNIYDDPGPSADDIEEVIDFAMRVSKVTRCLECGSTTEEPEGFCIKCLVKCDESDFTPDDKVDGHCCICQEKMDVPILRKKTRCCKEFLHKRCCAAAVRIHRSKEKRMNCPLCKSTKFENTTYAHEDDYVVPEYVNDDDDDFDDDGIM